MVDAKKPVASVIRCAALALKATAPIEYPKFLYILSIALVNVVLLTPALP